MGRFGTLIGKDLRVIGRNRTLVLTLVVYPLLMVAVLGLVFANPDRPVPVALVVGSEGNAPINLQGLHVSLDLVRDEIDKVAGARSFPDVESARDALRNGHVDAVIVFPDYFLADLVQDFRTRVNMTVILDASDPAKSTVAENIIRASIQRFNELIVTYKVEAVVDQLELALEGGTTPPFNTMSFREMREVLQRILDEEQMSAPNEARLAEVITFLTVAIEELEQGRDTVTSIALPINTNLEHLASGVLQARDIVVPAAVALSIFWTGILAAGSLVVYERQSHAQLRLNVTPIGMAPVVAAKLVVTAAIIVLQSLLIIVVAKVLWDIRIDNLILLLATLAAGAFSAVGLGLLIAGFSRDTNGATLLSVLAVFPMMFLSGLFFPISFMPSAAQAIARVLPLTYAVDGLRGSMLRDYQFADARLDLVVLLVIGALALAIGYVRNRRLATGG